MCTTTGLENVILFSNSIPKSGSSMLFTLQRELLYGMAGKQTPFGPEVNKTKDFNLFQKAGISWSGGFVLKKDLPKLSEYLINSEITDGPYAFKIHHELRDSLLDLFLSRRNVFLSLAIRDPEDILLSARDNFLRTGEFTQFAKLETGCKQINGWFQAIYDSCTDVHLTRQVPVVRYEQIIGDNVGAIYQSFAPELREIIFRAAAARFLDFAQARSRASHRRSSTSEPSRAEQKTLNEFLIARDQLSVFRNKLGYGESLLPSKL